LSDKPMDGLLRVLRQDARLFSADGAFLRNVAFELAMKGDADLLRSLLANEETKKHFFTDVDGTMVFNSQRFGWVVSNREFLPDSYTRFKNVIGLVDSRGNFLDGSQDLELVWPFKDCWLEGGQSKGEEGREEVFYNETLAPTQVDRLLSPKVLTGARRFTKNGSAEASDFTDSDNLILKGNNLLGIASLLPRFEGQIRVIYIDPPYNPRNNNNTFCYNNRFNHSTWLTFMANRLRVAKRLLRPDGALIVAIDDNEHSYLGVLLNEIFPKHDVESIVIVHNPRGVQGTNFSYTHESAYFVLPKNMRTVGDKENGDVAWTQFRNWGGESRREDAANCFYPVIVEDDGRVVGFGDVMQNGQHPAGQTVKDGKRFLVYPIDSSGVERKWRYARQSVERVNLRARLKKDGGFKIEIGKSSGMYKSVWIDTKYDANKYGTQLVKKLVPGSKFDFPKSLYNVLDCLRGVIQDDPDAIVLDFFAGSGTTGHAVLELNKMDGGHRRFILVEQMDYVDTITAPRVAQVINDNSDGSFIYCELKKLNQDYVGRIQDAKSTKGLLKIWEEIKGTEFISYRVRPELFDVETFATLDLAKQKEAILEMLDKNLLYVNYWDIDDQSYVVSDEDKVFNANFYGASES